MACVQIIDFCLISFVTMATIEPLSVVHFPHPGNRIGRPVGECAELKTGPLTEPLSFD